MVQKNVVVLIDDLTGKELPEGTGETVRFSLDGVSYVLDVDTKGLRDSVPSWLPTSERVAGWQALGRPADHSE